MTSILKTIDQPRGAHDDDVDPRQFRLAGSQLGRLVTFRLFGDLDCVGEPVLVSAIGRLLSPTRTPDVHLDLAACSFLDSAGLRGLVIARRELGSHRASLTMSGAVPRVRVVLDITGMTSHLDLRD